MPRSRLPNWRNAIGCNVMVDIGNFPRKTQGISRALKSLAGSALKDRTVKVALQDGDGVAKVETLQGLMVVANMATSGAPL